MSTNRSTGGKRDILIQTPLYIHPFVTPTDNYRLKLNIKHDCLSNGYPLTISEAAYPPQVDPAESASQAVGALAAIGATLYARGLEATREANHLIAMSNRIGQAIDRYASIHAS